MHQLLSSVRDVGTVVTLPPPLASLRSSTKYTCGWSRDASSCHKPAFPVSTLQAMPLAILFASSSKASLPMVRHQLFSYCLVCLLAQPLLSLKAEHLSSSLSHTASQPQGCCLLPRGSLLWRLTQGRREAWRARRCSLSLSLFLHLLGLLTV